MQAFEEWREYRLAPALDLAMQDLERKTMQAVYDECHRLRYEDPRLPEIQKLLGISDADLLKRQYQRAVETGNTRRAVDREIKLKETHLLEHGRIIRWQDCPQLRTPTEYGNAKFVSFKRAEIAAGMMVFATSPIPTSLSRLSEKKTIKIAIHMFKAVMGYMGDRKASHPEELASEIIANAIEHPELQTECFLQIMKQLSQNPKQSSVSRGWDLLGIVMMTIGPPSPFENYLQMFVRRNAPNPLPFIGSIYERLYQGNRRQPPQPHEIAAHLHGFRQGGAAEKYASHAASLMKHH